MRNHYDTLDVEGLARKRAAAKMSWYIHAIVYILVNLMLVAMAAAAGKHWAVFPAFGWGLGLAIHGIVVFLVVGGGLMESMVDRERQRLAQRDAW